MNCIIIGDYGTSDKFQKLVANSMVDLIKGNNIKFICGLGDNIYEGGVKSVSDNKFQTHFEEPYKDIKLRFYQCIGNHDYGPIYFNHIPDDYKHQIEYTKLSKKWYLPKRYYHYSKKMGNLKVDFFVLDTNIDLMNEKEILDQLEYFKDKILKSNADWRILYGHHTYRSVAGHGNAEPVLENFLNALFSYGKIDLYMCGHDHTKQLIQTKINKKDITMIVCGTGGKPYNYGNNYQNTPDLIFSSHNLGYGLCDARKNHLLFEFKDSQNHTEFKCQIKKT